MTEVTVGCRKCDRRYTFDPDTETFEGTTQVTDKAFNGEVQYFVCTDCGIVVAMRYDDGQPGIWTQFFSLGSSTITETINSGTQHMDKEYLDRLKELSPHERLVRWIHERERARLGKEKGWKKPWTQHPIIQTCRFCNVRRMDDKVSKWLLENWYKPYFNHPMMVPAVVIARHFNQPECLHELTAAIFDPTKGKRSWKPAALLKILKKRKAEGRKIFNGAYIIRASKEYPDKAQMTIEETTQAFIDKPLKNTFHSMQETVESLQQYRNIGSFMAGQIAADLRWAVDGTWKDRNKWAAIGPGSQRGMNRYHERPINQSLSQEQFNVELMDQIAALKKEPTIKKSLTRLEAIDFQNTNCEFDKVERVLWNEGRTKAKYPGVRS